MRFHAKRVTKFLSITLVLTLFFISLHVVTAAGSANDEDTISTPEYIMECYDGVGFADRHGGISDLQSTLDAVSLLMETEEKWPYGLWHMVDNVVTRYKSMQSPYRGGFVQGNVSKDGPDFRTTALILETLQVIGRLDEVDIPMVERYLWSSFRESLTMDLWLTEGDFDQKYWALRTAAIIDNVEILGIKKLDLDRIIGPDANRADFPEDETYLRWGDEHFEGSIYGGFTEEPQDRQFKIIDSFSMMLSDEDYARTIVPLLVDSEAFVDAILEGMAQESAIIKNKNGEKDLRRTARVYDILNKTGLLDQPFSDGTGAYRAVQTHDYLIRTRSNLRDGFEDRTTSLTDLHCLRTIQELLDRAINDKNVVFYPVFEDSHATVLASDDGESDTPTTGIDEWAMDYDDIVYVPKALLEKQTSTDKNSSLLPFLILMCSLIGSVVASGVLGEKNFTILLSICFIVLFGVQTGFSVDQVLRDVSTFVSDSFSNDQQPSLDQMLGRSMHSIGTLWLDLDYSGQAEAEEEDKSEQEGTALTNGEYIPAQVKSVDAVKAEVELGLKVYPNLRKVASQLRNLFIKDDNTGYNTHQVLKLIEIDTSNSDTITFEEGTTKISMSADAVRSFQEFLDGWDNANIKDILAVLDRVSSTVLENQEPVYVGNLENNMERVSTANVDGLIMLAQAVDEETEVTGDSGVTVYVMYPQKEVDKLVNEANRIHRVFKYDQDDRDNLVRLGLRINARMQASQICSNDANLKIQLIDEKGVSEEIDDSWGMDILSNAFPKGDTLARKWSMGGLINIYQFIGEQITHKMSLGRIGYTHAWMWAAASVLEKSKIRLDHVACFSFGDMSFLRVLWNTVRNLGIAKSKEKQHEWEAHFLKGAVNPILKYTRKIANDMEKKEIRENGFAWFYSLKDGLPKIGIRFYRDGEYSMFPEGGKDTQIVTKDYNRDEITSEAILAEGKEKGYIMPHHWAIVAGENVAPRIFKLGKTKSGIDLNALVGNDYSSIKTRIDNAELERSILDNKLMEMGSEGLLEPNNEYILNRVSAYISGKVDNLPVGLEEIEAHGFGAFQSHGDVELDIALEELTLSEMVATQTIAPDIDGRIYTKNEEGGTTVNFLGENPSNARKDTNSYMMTLYNYLTQNGRYEEARKVINAMVADRLVRTISIDRFKRGADRRVGEDFRKGIELSRINADTVNSLAHAKLRNPSITYDDLLIERVIPVLGGIRVDGDQFTPPMWGEVIDNVKKWAPEPYGNVFHSLYGGERRETGSNYEWTQILIQSPPDYTLRVRSWVVGEEKVGAESGPLGDGVLDTWDVIEESQVYVQAVDRYYGRGLAGGNLIMAGSVDALDGYYRGVNRVPVRNKQVKEAFDYLQEQCVLEVPVQAQLVRVNAEVLEVFASKLDGEADAVRRVTEILKSKLNEGAIEHGDFLVLVFDELEDW